MPVVADIAAHPKQDAFVRSKAFVRGFVAGRGTGKTMCGPLALCDADSGMEPGDTCIVVSPTSSDIQTASLKACKDVLGPVGWLRDENIVKSPRVRAKLTLPGGSAELLFFSGEAPRSLHGPSVRWLWIDEASLQQEIIYKDGLATLRAKDARGRPVAGRVMLTFTPRGKKHWTYGVFFDRFDGTAGQSAEIDRLARLAASKGDPWLIAKASARREAYEAGRDLPTIDSELIQASTLENPFNAEEFAERLARSYTTQYARQMIGGEFVDLEGQLFQREWFTVVEAAPARAERVRYWDKAATDGGGCHTVGLLMSKTPAGVFTIEDVVRGQWSPLERENVILATAQDDAAKFGNVVRIYVEQEPGSGGKESAEMTVRKLAGFPVYRDLPSGTAWKIKQGLRVPGHGKVVRAEPLAAQAEAQNVEIVRAGWNNDFLDELCAFPEAADADQADAASGAFNALTLTSRSVEQVAPTVGASRPAGGKPWHISGKRTW